MPVGSEAVADDAHIAAVSEPRIQMKHFGLVDPWISPEISSAVWPKYVVENRRYNSLREAVASCASVELDFGAINCFLRSGFYLRDRTPFLGVRRATRPIRIIAARPRPRSRAISEYIDVFRRAVRRRVTPDAILGLSGGADSRHILLELAELGALPELAITVDLPVSNDAEIARRLASTVGVNHRVVPPSDSPEDELRKCIAVELMSLQHRWFMAAANQIRHHAWWDGIGGDVLSAGLFLERWNLDLMNAGAFETYADRLVRPGRVPWFGPRGRFDRDQAVHEVSDELRRHAEAANPVGSFYFWNRTCSDIAASPFGIVVKAGARPLTPYLDEDVWSCLASIPAAELLDHSFHVEAIARAHPAMSLIPYSRKRPLPPRLNLERARRLASYLWPRVLRSPSFARMEVLAHSLRTILTGAGDSDGLLATWSYSEGILGRLDRRMTRE